MQLYIYGPWMIKGEIKQALAGWGVSWLVGSKIRSYHRVEVQRVVKVCLLQECY